jgi:hypothetical protein
MHATAANQDVEKIREVLQKKVHGWMFSDAFFASQVSGVLFIHRMKGDLPWPVGVAWEYY